MRLFVSLWIDSGIALQDPGAKIQEKPDNPDTFLAEIWNSCFVCDLYSTVFCLPERISTAVILQIYLSGGTLEGGLTLVLGNPSLRAAAGVLFDWKVLVLLLFW